MATIASGVEPQMHSRLEEERKVAFPEGEVLQRFRDYTAGVQPIRLTDEQKSVLEGLLTNSFCDNVCRRVVSTVSARVRLERMEVASQPVEAFLQDLFVKNHVRQLSNRVHYSSIRDGDNYVSLGWSLKGQRVTLFRELAWNGKRGVFMGFDEAGESAYAVKEWDALELAGEGAPLTAVKRRVVWFPNRIGRFVQRNGGWQWFTLPGEAGGWLPWTANGKEDGEPLGLPCVKFSRMEQPADGRDDVTGISDNYGVSILAGGMLGIQDAVNDDHYSILAANRMTAYQVAYATGVKMIDSNGKDVRLKMIPGALIHVEDEKAKLGTLPAGDMAQLINTLKTHHEAGSRSTNTPLHVISGDWPSGEALIQADRPLVDQAYALADNYGPAWATVGNRAVRIANAFGRAGLDSAALITAIFRTPERDDQLSRAVIAQTIAPYVSNQEILRKLGYSEEKIKQIMAERTAEAAFLMGDPNAEGQATQPGDFKDASNDE